MLVKSGFRNLYTSKSISILIFITALVSACGGSSSSDGVPQARQAAPAALMASSGDGSVSLTWTAAGGASSYKVYRSVDTASGTSGALVANGITELEFTDQDLATGIEHHYVVTAVGSSESNASNNASATPFAAFSQTSSGDKFNCGIRMNGTLWCWGQNGSYKLAQGPEGTEDNYPSPVRIDSTGDGTASRDWLLIDAGDFHSCAIKTDGSLWCWGDNFNGELAKDPSTVPSSNVPLRVDPANDWVNVKTKAYHSCAKKSNGTLWCWGVNSYLTSRADDPIVSVPTQINSGADVSTTDWNDFALGDHHVCASKQTGSLWCWGYNSNGQIGLPPMSGNFYPVPQLINSSLNWKTLDAGWRHTCGLVEPEAGILNLYCWGWNRYGQLGSGINDAGLNRPADSDTPLLIGSMSDNWVQVALGDYHSCGIQDSGLIFCWGRNGNGQLGTDSTDDIVTPTQISSVSDNDWLQLSAGYFSSCATKTDNSLWCWGGNRFGQLGNGTIANKLDPVLIDNTQQWTAVDGGHKHTCAIANSGAENTVWCWGDNFAGQLGDNSDIIRSTPVQETRGFTNWDSLALGGYHSCGIRSNGTLWCWGSNNSGQGGQNPVGNESLLQATQVGGATTWQQVGSGGTHTCGISADVLYCWGSDFYGQLGNGAATVSNQFNPVTVSVPAGQGSAVWSWIGTTWDQSCGVLSNGTLWCWGSLITGESAGNVVRTATASPVQVGIDTDWQQVDGSPAATCAIKTNGSLYCWGDNRFGLLGVDGARTVLTVPTPVMAPTNTVWTKVKGLRRQLCSFQSASPGNTLWCWGDNYYGTVGNGTNDSVFEPTQESTLATNWIDFATSGEHNCGVRDDGSLWCWGNNDEGQLGDGNYWTAVPERIETPRLE